MKLACSPGGKHLTRSLILVGSTLIALLGLAVLSPGGMHALIHVDAAGSSGSTLFPCDADDPDCRGSVWTDPDTGWTWQSQANPDLGRYIWAPVYVPGTGTVGAGVIMPGNNWTMVDQAVVDFEPDRVHSWSASSVDVAQGGSDVSLPPGYIATDNVLYWWAGSSWVQCDESGWGYNSSSGHNVALETNWSSFHPCGPGYYGTLGAAFVWDDAVGGWLGSWAWSNYVYCDPPGSTRPPAPTSHPHTPPFRPPQHPSGR